MNQKGFIIYDSDYKYEIVKENVRPILKEIKMSEMALSKAIGIPYATMKRSLNNPESMPLLVALRMSEVLERPIRELFELGKDGWMRCNMHERNAYIHTVTLEVFSETEMKQYIQKNENEAVLFKQIAINRIPAIVE